MEQADFDRIRDDIIRNSANARLAFAALVTEFRGLVVKRVWAICPDFHTAEDIAQDVFMELAGNAVKTLERAKTPGNLGSWLQTVAHNKVINWRRSPESRRTYAADYDLSSVAATDAGAVDEAIGDEMALRAEKALEELRKDHPKWYSVLVLTERDGLEHRDIADSLSITEVNSRQYLSRAKNWLNERLGLGKNSPRSVPEPNTKPVR